MKRRTIATRISAEDAGSNNPPSNGSAESADATHPAQESRDGDRHPRTRVTQLHREIADGAAAGEDHHQPQRRRGDRAGGVRDAPVEDRRPIVHHELQPQLHRDAHTEAHEQVAETIAQHREGAATSGDRTRQVGIGARPTAAQRPRDHERQRATDDRAERVGHEVAGVEEPVRARVDTPDARQLRRLDQERQTEARGERDHDAAPGEHTHEHPERHEQQHVECELQKRRVSQRVPRGRERGLHVADHGHRVGDRADAPDRVGVGQGKERVVPDRPEVDQGREPEDRAAESQSSAPTVADRHEGDEEHDAEGHADRYRDEAEQHLIPHNVSV